MNSAYVLKLCFIIQKIDVSAQKIDGSVFIIYRMVIVGFSLHDKLDRVWFFEEIFLLANSNIEVVLKRVFLASLMQTYSL